MVFVKVCLAKRNSLALIFYVHSNLDCNYATDDIFIDFSKAFDRVPHQPFLLKSSALNIDPNILALITDFLNGRS